MKQKSSRGFTIVELLVVIVVIGILAAITIVSYSGIVAKANTATAQSEASAAYSKINAYMAEVGTVPTSYGALTGAAASTVYSAPSLNFTIASGNKNMTTFRPTGITSDALDFSLCGTNTTAAATTYATVNVPTGIIVGYWNYAGAGSLDTTTTVGTTSGNHTNGYAVTCYKVGIAEAAVAVAKAIYAETGTYPATAAAINAGSTTTKMPFGITAVRTGAPNAGTGATTVHYECGASAGNALPCLNTGGRITYYDFQGSTTAQITYGTNAGYAAPAS